MVMKDKQCLLSFKAIRVENPSTLINSVSISELSRTNELFSLYLIYSNLELLFLCLIAMMRILLMNCTNKTYKATI